MSTFYGTAYRWFIGTITEAGDCDPLGLGRVKVRIDGVHGKNIKNSDLPFAQCVLPTTGGGTSGIGENPRLEAGARVCGYFIDGDVCQLPLILGTIPHYGQPNLRQLDNQVTYSQATFRSIVPTARSFVTNASLETTVEGDSRTNPEIAWDFFSNAHNQGLNFEYENHQIAGMIGNFMVESKNLGPALEENGLRDPTLGNIPSNYKRFYIEMDPTAKGDFDEETDTYTAIGIAQWRNNRRENLLNYAANQGPGGSDPLNLIIQLRFVDWELSNDRTTSSVFFATDTIDEATMMFMRLYERPQVLEGKSKIANGTAGAMHHERFFGYPPGYWNLRAGEQDRLDNANEVYIKETQTTSGGDDA